MFYAAKVELENQAQWKTSRLESQYKIWVAQYPAQPYPQTESSPYAGKHHMWQFTASGTVAGISTGVGWSRVEWNGQVLYCISSYLMLAEARPTE